MSILSKGPSSQLIPFHTFVPQEFRKSVDSHWKASQSFLSNVEQLNRVVPEKKNQIQVLAHQIPYDNPKI